MHGPESHIWKAVRCRVFSVFKSDSSIEAIPFVLAMPCIPLYVLSVLPWPYISLYMGATRRTQSVICWWDVEKPTRLHAI